MISPVIKAYDGEHAARLKRADEHMSKAVNEYVKKEILLYNIIL